MKTWFSKILGKEQKPPPAGGDAAIAPQADAEQTLPADTDQTVLGSAPPDPQAIHAAEAQVAVEWRVGDVILDLYEVKHVFEGGGMGLVYRVHHRGWNIDLAVKSPRRDYFKTEAQKQNFTRECETWINLGLHPHIVSCHYVRTLGGIPRVFAEYVEGGTLKEWIDSRELYEGGEQESLKRILDIAIQMAWGLHYAHEQGQGLVHQDVKPANVLMMPDGTAKITDFGLAKAQAASDHPSVAGGGRSILVSSGGMTPAYCSPEQANKQSLSRKTDIWSWAVSVLEMFAGEVCWQSGIVAPEALKHLADMRVEGEFPEPPAELLKLLEQCFAVKPDGRPENFRVVADTLKSIYQTLAGKDHARELPEAANIQADMLNNRAVSMLDLGRVTEAESLFDQALAMAPCHPQATYNRGLHLWRDARITDYAIVQALDQSRLNWSGNEAAHYLLGLIHLERRDAEGAMAALTEAEQIKPSSEIQQAIREATRLEFSGLLRTFEEQPASVQCVAISADGRLALSSTGEALRLWDLGSGKSLRTFHGPGYFSNVEAVALSADARLALSIDDVNIRLWSVSTGECLKTFGGGNTGGGKLNSVALSADGRWALASAYMADTFRLWDVNSGECLRTFKGHKDNVKSVAVSEDSRWALSGSGGYITESKDNAVRLWDMSNGNCLKTFEGHTNSVASVVLSRDGRWALSGSYDKTLRLWELSSGRCVKLFRGHTDAVFSVALSADGHWALSGSADKTIRLWEARSGRCLRTFVGHERNVNSVALSADGHWALSGSWDKTIRLWDLKGLSLRNPAIGVPLVICLLAGAKAPLDNERRFSVLLGDSRKALADRAWSGAWNLAAEAKALAGYEFKAEALDVAHQAGLRGRRKGLRRGWAKQVLEGHTGGVASVALSADGCLALSGSGFYTNISDNTLRLWDLNRGKCLKTFAGHGGGVTAVALSADNRRALSGSNDHTVRLWDVSSGECVRTFEGTDSVTSVALSVDGRWALVGSWWSLCLWEVSTGKCRWTHHDGYGGAVSLALSADGRWALSGAASSLHLWDVSSGKRLRTFKGHKDDVHSVALSADGRWALSGSGEPGKTSDNTVRLWEVSSGKCLRTFVNHEGNVRAVALSADGRLALSACGDSSNGKDYAIYFWEVSSGKRLRTFEGHTYNVHSLALSADGRWLLSGSDDKTLRLWELDWDSEFPEQKDWDEGARPHLQSFLTLHCAEGEDGFTRVGKPLWAEEDFQKLIVDLQHRGYGWLRPEGVRQQLEKMTSEWQGPPPLPWEQNP